MPINSSYLLVAFHTSKGILQLHILMKRSMPFNIFSITIQFSLKSKSLFDFFHDFIIKLVTHFP